MLFECPKGSKIPLVGYPAYHIVIKFAAYRLVQLPEKTRRTEIMQTNWRTFCTLRFFRFWRIE